MSDLHAKVLQLVALQPPLLYGTLIGRLTDWEFEAFNDVTINWDVIIEELEHNGQLRSIEYQLPNNECSIICFPGGTKFFL